MHISEILPAADKGGILAYRKHRTHKRAHAVAKIAGIKLCQSYNRQFGTNFISVIPANVYGINDHFDEGGHVVAGLIKDSMRQRSKVMTALQSGELGSRRGNSSMWTTLQTHAYSLRKILRQ